MSRDLTQNGDDMDGVLPDLSQFGAAVEPLRPTWDADGHIDEGTVHTWLDGAFSADDAAAIDAHVATCTVCGARVAEARGLLAASARILGALDGVPAGVVPAEDAARTAARIAAEVPMPAAVVPVPTTRVQRQRAWHAQPWLRAAAVLVVAIGTGVVWQRGGVPEVETLAVSDTVRTAPSVVTAVAPAASTAPAPTAPAPTAPAPTASAAPASAAPTTATPSESQEVVRAAASVQPPAARVAETRALIADSNVVANDASSTQAFAPSAARSSASGLGVVPSSMRASAAVGREYVVRGTVLDPTTTRPVEGANVLVGRRTRGTDAWMETAVTSVSGGFRVALHGASAADSLVVAVRRIGFEPHRMVSLATGDSMMLRIAMRVSSLRLSEVTVASVPATANAPAPQTRTQDFAGRGVAGGIARGAESVTRLNASVAATRAAQPPARPPRNYNSLTDAQYANEFNRPNDREQYDRILDNPFLGARDNPLSTFSIDVDRAAFGNVRRFLTQGQRPPKDAVRIEEMINWFPYDLPEPRGTDPVAITSEVITAPWQPQHRLVRIALQSKRIATDNLPASNLVFLIDVSGSMMDPNKLPLVKQSLRLLVDALRPQDRVAIVTYAGAAGLVLPSTSGDEKAEILAAIDRLSAGGSTAGGAGIELAYRTAREHFLDRGNNRVVLATDGDFNVGVSSDAELERLIERRRTEGTYLTVLGFGMGNYQDAKMQKLAKAGNGNYAYIDELREAQKVLVQELGATLVTVANDVKLQVEFNPSLVQAYRLIGYEDRLLRTEDFNDDKKDAGDMGAGHQVTALYEVVPVGVEGTVTLRGIDSLRYATPAVTPRTTARNGELMFVKLRYKRPGESTSQLMSHAVPSRVAARGSDDTRFAAAVAGFGMLMRDSEYKGTTSAAQLLVQARAARGDDDGGYRSALIQLIERWRAVTAAERR